MCFLGCFCGWPQVWWFLGLQAISYFELITKIYIYSWPTNLKKCGFFKFFPLWLHSCWSSPQFYHFVHYKYLKKGRRGPEQSCLRLRPSCVEASKWLKASQTTQPSELSWKASSEVFCGCVSTFHLKSWNKRFQPFFYQNWNVHIWGT